METLFTNGGYLRRQFQPWPDPVADPAKRIENLIAQLRVTAFSASEWILYPRFYHEPRPTNDVNWMWIPDATGEVRIGEDQRPIPVRPGDHIFLPAGTIHAEWFPMRNRWRMYSVHFSASVMGGMDFIQLSGFPLHVPGAGAHDPMGLVAARLCREFGLRSPGWPVAFRAGVEKVLLHVLRHHGSRFQTDINPLHQHAEFRLIPVFESIEERIGDNTLSIRDLARLVNVSDVRFRTLFRQVTGMRPVQYIQRRRIETARWLLVHSSLPVKEIAIRCGFQDPAFFHRVFRKTIGATPNMYRQQLMS